MGTTGLAEITPLMEVSCLSKADEETKNFILGCFGAIIMWKIKPKINGQKLGKDRK